MSRYMPGLENSDFVFEAVNHWRDNCLLKDGSVFSNENLWTEKNLNDKFLRNLVKEILKTDQPDGNFMERLILQLENINAKSAMYKLLGESLWVMYLASSAMQPTTKKNQIKHLWNKSGTELPDNEYLKDKYMEGHGRPGMGFAMYLWAELMDFVLFVREIKKLSADKRETYLKNSNGVELSRQWDKWPEQWRKNFPGESDLLVENRQIRHMLLHLLFPDHFERVFSGTDKMKIVKKFTSEDASDKSWSEIDKILQTIRKEREAHYGTSDIDFYVAPLVHDWRGGRSDPTDKENTNTAMSHSPLNQIFYGPPGTGKTYRTVNAAVEIVDSTFYKENENNRLKLRGRYEELMREGKIAFVTFHQSFGYEEFVEGIRPVMGGDGKNVSYEIKGGILKNLCKHANDVRSPISIDGAIKKLQEEVSKAPVTMKTLRGKKFTVIRTKGQRKDTFPYNVPNQDGSNVNIKEIKDMCRGIADPGVRNPSYARGVIEYFKKEYGLITNQPNVVLIIDEINRGNISRIFGDLITLIEESKRLGSEEETTAQLPYSGEPFGVPNNLYIIGTMNTADRSIALLDTALRRRFRFVEMMPEWELLSDIEVGEIDIAEMLRIMNERIEALYDRDHQIGHSYFLRLADNNTIETLKDIFQHEVLPLLQEYFYDDWEKINLVLNDNKFLKYEDPPKMPSNDFMDNEKKLWSIDEKALGKSANYQDIYTDEQVDSSS